MIDSIGTASSADYFYSYNAPDFGSVLWHFEILQEHFQVVHLDTIIGNIAEDAENGIALSVNIQSSRTRISSVQSIGCNVCVLRAVKQGALVKISLYSGILTDTVKAYVESSHDLSVQLLQENDRQSVA